MSILNNYNKIRTQGTKINSDLFKMLNKDDFTIIGRLLGILHKGQLYIDDQGKGTTMDHFADFAIHDYCDKSGLNVIQKYLNINTNISEFEKDYLLSNLNAKCSLFSIVNSDLINSTLVLQDLFNDNNEIEIIESSMSQNPDILNYLIFTRIVTIDNINMTSGAAIMFLKDDEDLLSKKYHSMIKKTFAHSLQAKQFIVFLKLNEKYGVPVLYK